MTDVLLERRWDPPLTKQSLLEMGDNLPNCFALYRVDWDESMLSTDGTALLCRFSGPDAESVRQALRQGGADITTHWPGTVHDAPGLDESLLQTANVVVERDFPDGVEFETVQAQEEANIACLETHRVKFVRTYFSLDQRRMMCLYRAPDTESVRIAQRQAEMPVSRIWPARRIRPTTP